MAGSSNLVEEPESSAGNSDSASNLIPVLRRWLIDFIAFIFGSNAFIVTSRSPDKLPENKIQHVEKLTEKINSNGNCSKKERKAQVATREQGKDYESPKYLVKESNNLNFCFIINYFH